MCYRVFSDEEWLPSDTMSDILFYHSGQIKRHNARYVGKDKNTTALGF
jgi:hypothetical protein